MGGAWERMVRSVKTALNVILMSENATLNDYTLVTLLTEVEALINSRPLTWVSDDVKDFEPLTPNHFLIGRSSSNLSPCITYESNVMPRQRWRQVQSMTEQFWNRWRKEYLPTLTSRNKWMTGSRNVQVGDLVMLLDQNMVRGRWSLGRISNVFPGRDNVVRHVEVDTSTGRYIRPLTKISPLELN